mmetsp:Transcript_10185/g.7632  ORF Transcript_10185/g.7632 Transcript_10185/m.7632 type:complete len:101 (+) Transcript_10185:438-740(+)|eukprot:CAMPEP_0202964872 /NCGR_PEP_ID=MMETSP1396-20130829/8989_1 /ASSEMBLY_ACC=CAM_ASM_000872 /TAXON_ID= /ORGANISM="Pseudokeronopsis sp., Strain Brazil" /LENGTH=100 /DNA_ID=CAMNT_0049687341 /DNA_START=637 /DNA_END=939 /DNA_ORIENTATION=-
MQRLDESKSSPEIKDTVRKMHGYFSKVYGDLAFQRYSSILENKNVIRPQELKQKHERMKTSEDYLSKRHLSVIMQDPLGESMMEEEEGGRSYTEEECHIC